MQAQHGRTAIQRPLVASGRSHLCRRYGQLPPLVTAAAAAPGGPSPSAASGPTAAHLHLQLTARFVRLAGLFYDRINLQVGWGQL